MVEILKQNPKAAKKIREYYENLFIQRLKGFTDEDKQKLNLENIFSEDKLADLLEANPYFLVYLLDENGIYVIIDGGEPIWFWKIDVETSINFKSRKEAEREGIITGIKLLEEKL